MRLSVSYRIARSRGFFIGRRLFFYKRRFFGYVLPNGVGAQPQTWWRLLADGPLAIVIGPSSGCTTVGRTRRQQIGLVLLRQLSALQEPFWASAWATLRYLKIRHLRGWRYRLGLPAHGQRTHSNAATTRRIKSTVSAHIRAYYWAQKLWEPRKRPTFKSKARTQAQSRRATKAERHKKGVVRTKKIKKRDAWR